MLCFALCAAFAQPVPEPVVQLDTLTLDAARRLSCQRVTVAFTVVARPYTFVVGDTLRTIAGPEDADGVERVVSLVGDRLGDLVEGEEVQVKGVLRVVHHPAAVVAGVRVEAWDEIRVEE